nr:uncharacterized protein LOC127310048 [Lolium perenne]
MVSLTLCVLARPDVDRLPEIFTSLGLDYDEKVLPSIGNEVLEAPRMARTAPVTRSTPRRPTWRRARVHRARGQHSIEQLLCSLHRWCAAAWRGWRRPPAGERRRGAQRRRPRSRAVAAHRRRATEPEKGREATGAGAAHTYLQRRARRGAGGGRLRGFDGDGEDRRGGVYVRRRRRRRRAARRGLVHRGEEETGDLGKFGCAAKCNTGEDPFVPVGITNRY